MINVVQGITPLGKFGQRPYKFDSEDKVRLDIQADILGTEYDILSSYAAGNSIKYIACETGTDFKTVAFTIRKTIKILVGK